MHQVCLLIGSNIQPERNLPLSVTLLKKVMPVLQVSSVWESATVGSDGPNMLNAAILVSTPLEADDLKEQVLRPLEAQMGRVRTSDKNAPRTIDLDIIFFDQHCLEPNLWHYAFRVPHPRQGSPSKMPLIAWRNTLPFGFAGMSKSSIYPPE
jgi:2-amino-4-hydroxy-6-hydroxymethyldihydropteridine diphosphokinase